MNIEVFRVFIRGRKKFKELYLKLGRFRVFKLVIFKEFLFIAFRNVVWFWGLECMVEVLVRKVIF